MKILIIQEESRHKKNVEFREGICLFRAFKENNWTPTLWGKGHENFETPPNFNDFDFILNLENYGDEWIPDLSMYKKPLKILWSIDAHCRGEEPYEKIFKNGDYQLLLHSTLDYVKKPHHLWFPNSFCNHKIKNLKLEKKTDLCFVGNHVNRKPLLDFLTGAYGLKQHIFTIGDDMVKKINETTLHFNKNILNDLNYRNFETIGCGTALITDHNHMYDNLGFEDGENIIFYNDLNSLIEKLNYYLDNEEELTRIGKEGERLSCVHTYGERVKKLIKQISNR
tara:strand:+ start:1554 stop:2396 length:843 start_codon:yes stop_codon:yes gene_type:complete